MLSKLLISLLLSSAVVHASKPAFDSNFHSLVTVKESVAYVETAQGLVDALAKGEKIISLQANIYLTDLSSPISINSTVIIRGILLFFFYSGIAHIEF